MRRLAILTSLSLIVAACGSSESDGSVVDSSVTSEMPESGTDDAKVDVSMLADEPVFVDPVVDPVRFVSVDIVASVGGTLTLPLSPEVTATLSIPPGALDTDHTVTLSAVTSILAGDSGVLGVDIQPAGLWFPVTAMPRLTFTGVADGVSVTGWNDDGVATELFARPSTDSGFTVFLAHFSGAAVGEKVTPPKPKPIADLEAEVRTDLISEQERQIAGTDKEEDWDQLKSKWSKRFVDVDLGFIRPMLESVASGPCGPQYRSAMAITLGFWQNANILDIGYAPDQSLIAKVMQHELQCVEKACDMGDPTSFGQYLRVEQEANFLGVDEMIDLYGYDEAIARFTNCSLFRVTAMGRSSFKLPDGSSVSEGFVTKGVVAAQLSGGVGLLPMTVTFGGVESWDSFAASGVLSLFAALVGGGPVDVQCTLTPIGPSIARIIVSLSPSKDDPSGYSPTVAFKPFVKPGARVCAGMEFPESTWTLFASHLLLRSFEFTGDEIRHEFTSDERDPFGVYRVSEAVDLAPMLPPGLLTEGRGSILMNMQLVADRPPTSDDVLSDEGMIDKYAELMAS
jgi:hypothetical protein